MECVIFTLLVYDRGLKKSSDEMYQSKVVSTQFLPQKGKEELMIYSIKAFHYITLNKPI